MTTKQSLLSLHAPAVLKMLSLPPLTATTPLYSTHVPRWCIYKYTGFCEKSTYHKAELIITPRASGIYNAKSAIANSHHTVIFHPWCCGGGATTEQRHALDGHRLTRGPSGIARNNAHLLMLAVVRIMCVTCMYFFCICVYVWIAVCVYVLTRVRNWPNGEVRALRA